MKTKTLNLIKTVALLAIGLAALLLGLRLLGVQPADLGNWQGCAGGLLIGLFAAAFGKLGKVA